MCALRNNTILHIYKAIYKSHFLKDYRENGVQNLLISLSGILGKLTVAQIVKIPC